MDARPAAARQLLLVAGQAAAATSCAVPALAPGLDVPLFLHLAAAHRLRCAAFEHLHAQRDAAAASAARDGWTPADLEAGRLARVARNLAVLSHGKRALSILQARGIEAIVAPSAATALLAAGRTHYDLDDIRLLVSADRVDEARAALAERWPDSPVGIGAIAGAAAEGAAWLRGAVDLGAASGGLRVASFDVQIRALREQAARADARLDVFVALAALTEEPLDDNAARRRLAGDEVTRARRYPQRPARNLREIWVAGFPSAYGGADTELDHLIDLLRAHDVGVHLVPMYGADAAMRRAVIERGCHVHTFDPAIFGGRTVVSYCNGQFLEQLPAIAAAGRPDRVIWFNCMTWTFPLERAAHRQGLIDRFGFQSQYQRSMLLPLLEEEGPVRTFAYRPYFNPARVEWRYRDWRGSYRIGRISRDDANKFAPDTWAMFDRVQVPPGMRKEVVVLGYGPNAERRIGRPPAGLTCELWAPGSVSAETFYRSIDTMVHRTGGSRESSSRVVLEAYAHGVVPIVERDFAFPELVLHGETGYMGSTAEEMSEYATRLAHDPAAHRRLAENGRRFLEAGLGNAAACWQGWREILESSMW